MNYLLLNFATKSENGSTRREDFFNNPLSTQYANIQKKYSQLKRIDLERFIRSCFDMYKQQYYYILSPNFYSYNDEDLHFNNIIIRPETNNLQQQLLPQNAELILIGDVSIKNGEFIVKGIEVIDSYLPHIGELKVQAIAANAFRTKSFSNNGKYITVADYGDIKPGRIDSVFTRDFMNDLLSYFFIVPQPQTVFAAYDKWNRYIKFRQYYLSEQAKNGVEINSCEVVTAYVISKLTYKNEPEKYDKFILDELEAIKKDEQIIVTKQFSQSEPLPLLRITVDRNKKELFQDTVKNKNIPKFEQMLKRFTRAELSLSNSDGKKKIFLDERYRLFSADIEPDYNELENQYQNQLKKVFEEINSRYASAIKQRVDAAVDAEQKKLQIISKEQIAAKTKLLSENLENDVTENADKDIQTECKKLLNNKIISLQSEMDKAVNAFNPAIEKAKKNKNKAEIENLKQQQKDTKRDFEEQKKNITLDKSVIKSLYTERNKKQIEEFCNKLQKEIDTQLKQYKTDKTAELEIEFAPQIQNEKKTKEQEIAATLESEKATKKENETIRRYYIYFKILLDMPETVKNNIGKINPTRLMFNTNAEEAKIRRQSEALNNFIGGYVKNPFLATYLFASQELQQKSFVHTNNIDYFSQRLNDKQKEAVQKAVASESIFLLQGPPGTGKTEVIAEITAQLVKQGKRVLISSETHKAIDNVFERLPKIPEIRPLRLIPSQAGKDTNYSPEKLVDNFYINICDRLDKEITQFEHFNETKESFGEDYRKLQLDNQKLAKEKARIKDVDIKIESIKREINTLVEKADLVKEKLRNLIIDKDSQDRDLRNLKNLNFSAESNVALDSAKAQITEILKAYPHFNQDIYCLKNIYNADIEKIRQNISELSDNSDIVELEAKRARIKTSIANLRDENEDVIAGYEAEVKALQGQLKEVNTQIKAKSETANIDTSEMLISKILKKEFVLPEYFSKLPNEILDLKDKISDIINKEHKMIKSIDYQSKINSENDVVAELQSSITLKENEIKLEKENAGYEDYVNIETHLKHKVAEFFIKFNIITEYPQGDIGKALEIIGQEWKNLEQNFSAMESENKEKIPMYRKIFKYIQGGETIEEDRVAYTKKLFDNANVYGITCTSRNDFKADAIESFRKYGIDGLNIKQSGIDVVIIDEVSKSSFLDLLIPILFGKTVILVGDHRQLPPMYDLRHLKKEDFEDLDHSIINEQKNNEYTELYEECFFKTLFERIPNHLKVTLTKQYRSHEDIMRVFNHFYGDAAGKGSLTLGLSNQNDLRRHGLIIKNAKGKNIIERNKHIYFIDCGDSYEKFGDSTSATNELEAKVIATLAKQIDSALGKTNTYKVDIKRNKDDRMSMGVICTYGDQARLIRQKLKINSFKNICELPDEKFIISTVDDFQGDERDIIFVSMVRNPEPRNRARTRAEFVKKFERINVALSRARRLLVIVGSKEFLSEARIDLPDMNGNKSLDRNAYPIYREIINTIAVNGEIINSNEIVEEEKIKQDKVSAVIPITRKNVKIDIEKLKTAIINTYNPVNQKFELSTLNNTLREEIENFNFKNYGFSKFKDFCLSFPDLFEIKTINNGMAFIIPKFEYQIPEVQEVNID
jgi:Ni2+-binding GTPase involved in maturation of urease and hydrogenase